MRLDYTVSCGWKNRNESPRVLASRLLTCVQRLRKLDPLFSTWFVWTGWEIVGQLQESVDALGDAIVDLCHNVIEDWELETGYSYAAFTQLGEKNPYRLGLAFDANCMLDPQGFDNVHLSTNMFADKNPDFVTYPLWKSVLLALAESFDAVKADGYASTIDKVVDREGTFRPGWLNYVAPRFAELVSPPPSVISEYTPSGALFMAATDEVFNVDNPAHMAGFAAIEEALAPLNARPWPPDGGPA